MKQKHIHQAILCQSLLGESVLGKVIKLQIPSMLVLCMIKGQESHDLNFKPDKMYYTNMLRIAIINCIYPQSLWNYKRKSALQYITYSIKIFFFVFF